MWHKLLGDASLFRVLRGIDEDTVNDAKAGRCQHCGGALDSADYWRQPRGMPAELEDDGYVRRPSLCCRRDGCRRRLTPPLLTFLGRRVFVSVVVVLAAALAQGEEAPAVRGVAEVCGASPRSVRRWLSWWRESFVRLRPWLALKARLGGGLDEGALPRAALERFRHAARGDLQAALVQFLRAVMT